MQQRKTFRPAAWATALLVVLETMAAAEPPSVELTLRFEPVSANVDYESPEKGEYEKCRVKVERQGGQSGWVVIGPAGQVLRRFIDSNGDNVVDQWRYYKHGLEVYRDIDSDFNNKVDQFRWCNTAGTRWAKDEDEDGDIDVWKHISAEEATREAVRALVEGNPESLKALLIDNGDIQQLGIKQPLAEKLLAKVENPGEKLSSARSATEVITSDTKWMRFDGSMPGVIPAEAGKADGDLTVYENAMAIVQTGNETGLVEVGEMVRVGEAWKLTQIPRPLQGNSVEITSGGLLMQPKLASGATVSSNSGESVSEEMQKLLEQLQELDENSPSPSAGREALARYNSRRVELLKQLISLSETSEERNRWRRQMVDGLTAAVQAGSYPEGLQRLQSIEQRIRQSAPDSPLVPYVAYRRLLAEYSQRMEAVSSSRQDDAQDRQKVQDWWSQSLQRFVRKHPQAEDAPDALLQLGIATEFQGQTDEARKWYGRLAENHPDTQAGQRADGALRRLNLKGQPISFSWNSLDGNRLKAEDFRGQVLLVNFWATWCRPCKQELPQIRTLYRQYKDQGFTIVGVNLDATADPIQSYLSKHQVTWPQVHESGGLQSGPAKQFGIISLPTRFLVDAQGRVVNRNVSVSQLKQQVPKLLKSE